jgi:hypothetical protein
MSARGPKHYRSLEEFEREEIQPGMKCGWSLDDLYQEANFHHPEDDLYDSMSELDFER